MMIRKTKALWICWLLACCWTATGWTQEESTTQTRVVDFARDIKPILEAKCLKCHGPEKQEEGHRVDIRDEVIDVHVYANDVENSEWYLRITTDDPENPDYRMPPQDEPQLSAAEVALFNLWISEGADWPQDVTVGEAAEEQAADQPEPADFWAKLWKYCGRAHPASTHFPVALLIVGALFALIGMRGESRFAAPAFYCLWLGALSAVVACTLGWSDAALEGHSNWQSETYPETIFLHRWGGILLAVLAILLAIVATGSRRKNPYGTGAMWKLGLVVLAVFCGFIAHQGGEMVHPGQFDDLFEKLGVNQLWSQSPSPDQPGDEQTDDAASTGNQPKKTNPKDQEAAEAKSTDKTTTPQAIDPAAKQAGGDTTEKGADTSPQGAKKKSTDDKTTDRSGAAGAESDGKEKPPVDPAGGAVPPTGDEKNAERRQPGEQHAESGKSSGGKSGEKESGGGA